jgi:hypothetical protein
MRLCDDKHDALVYDDRRDECPACDERVTTDRVRGKLALAVDERDALDNRVADLEAQLASAKDGRIDAERELAQQRMTSRA